MPRRRDAVPMTTRESTPRAGPCISRKTKEITSPPACGPGQEAVSRLQRFGRMCISKQQRIAKFWNHLSGTAAGVREVLADAAERRIRDRVDRMLGAARNKRTEGRLRLAARYTQRMWRSKRAYAFNDENARPRRPCTVSRRRHASCPSSDGVGGPSDRVARPRCPNRLKFRPETTHELV